MREIQIFEIRIAIIIISCPPEIIITIKLFYVWKLPKILLEFPVKVCFLLFPKLIWIFQVWISRIFLFYGSLSKSTKNSKSGLWVSLFLAFFGLICLRKLVKKCGIFKFSESGWWLVSFQVILGLMRHGGWKFPKKSDSTLRAKRAFV